MTDYNFAKNYENIKDWEFKNQSPSGTESDNFVDQLLNLINSYPNLILLIKTKKILFVPTLFVLAGVVIVEIVALIPAINIKRLESKHFEYEDKVNALNGINLDLENKFIKLKKHTSLLSNPSPAYLFGFYLQESLPKDVQLFDYLVDNSGFKLNATSSDLISANKFISLLLENKLVDKESIKINRIINQSANNQSSFSEQSFPVDSIAIEISGKIVHLPLEERIESSKSSEDFGKFKKLNDYFELLELLR
mgnify:FL=1